MDCKWLTVAFHLSYYKGPLVGRRLIHSILPNQLVNNGCLKMRHKVCADCHYWLCYIHLRSDPEIERDGTDLLR